MPRLWRYLLRNYLQVFTLCVAGFISVLLVTRFQHIARFAATGASNVSILKFIAFQVPFILPLAIPISCLIASFLLLQKMSRTHELTALRVAGLGIFPIVFPLILMGALIGMLNFTLISEIAPKCRTLSKNLAYQMTAVNPLSLLQKETLIKLKNTYIDLKVLKSGQYAEDVLFIMRNASNQRLSLTLTKKLALDGQNLMGSNVSFISSIDSKNSDCFDHLIIENQEEMQTQSNQLLQYLKSNDWNINPDYLNLRLLQAKYMIENEGKMHAPAYQEIARRGSLALAAITFTLVGIAFGIEISRNLRLRGVVWAISLMTLYLISFVAAKSMKHDWIGSMILYLAPHPIILFFCFRSFKNIMQGTE